MFGKVLIANRGEIALRIIRACREMGIKTVLAYSEADADSLPAKLADERICIGPATSSKSYLNIPNIISAAFLTGAEAIHPGYGFLSENTSFAEICSDCNLVFIGPPPAATAQMSDKALARKIMSDGGLPILPGSLALHSLAEAEAAAEQIGYPVMIKASAGGGGRGIRLVHTAHDLAQVFLTAQSEVREAFHDDSLYIEKYISHAKHIEVQVLIDNFDNGIHLGERNCSVQRRHQKLLEEAPSPILPLELRQEIGEKALQASLSIGYRGAGTLEFLVDDDYHYYFMEMNTRLQVEHPITEVTTGIDIVQEQIKIASNNPLSTKQNQIQIQGHAIEMRICAENPELDFRPSTGTIEEYLPPGGPGVRIDSHLYEGYSVPPHYDSLLAKLIVWGANRDEAILRARRALDEYVISGVPTTIPFHKQLLTNKTFLSGNTYTNFVQEHAEALVSVTQ